MSVFLVSELESSLSHKYDNVNITENNKIICADKGKIILLLQTNNKETWAEELTGKQFCELRNPKVLTMRKKSEKRQVKHLPYVKNLDLLCMKMLFALSQSNGGMRNSLNALVNFNWTRGILTKLVYCTKLSFKRQFRFK